MTDNNRIMTQNIAFTNSIGASGNSFLALADIKL